MKYGIYIKDNEGGQYPYMHIIVCLFNQAIWG